MSLIDIVALATKSINLGLDGPIYGVSSPCTLVVVLVCHFYDNGEMGFCAFLFVDEPACIVPNSSSISTDLSDESRSL